MNRKQPFVPARRLESFKNRIDGPDWWRTTNCSPPR